MKGSLILHVLAIVVGMKIPAHCAADPRPVVAIIVSGVARSDVNADGVRFTSPRRQIEEFESALAECIQRALAEQHPGLRVLMPKSFYELAFPMLSPEEAPRSLGSLQILLQDDSFRSRLRAAGVRQLVVAGGAAQRRYHSGAVLPYGVASPAGGIIWFWGSVVWDNDSQLAAYVIDLDRKVPMAEVQSFAEDQSRFGVHIYLPTGSPSRAHAEACSDLGTKVADILRHREPLPDRRQNTSR